MLFLSAIVTVPLASLLWVVLCAQLVQPKFALKRASVGFLHPSCAGGGGGERVLWCAVRAVIAEASSLLDCDRKSSEPSRNAVESARVWIYTRRYRSSPEALRSFVAARLAEQFGAASFSDAVGVVRFMPLYTAVLLDPHLYPCFTMLLQLLAGMFVAAEIVLRHAALRARRFLQTIAVWSRVSGTDAVEAEVLPSVVLDTMGIPLALLCLKWWTLGRIRTGAYVHYPLVSSEMMMQARERARGALRSVWWTGRFAYYRSVLLPLYARCGAATDIVMANSSWTRDHMKRLWCRGDEQQVCQMRKRDETNAIHLVFPPCGPARTGTTLPTLDTKHLRQRIVSIAQFRPEKKHEMQIECFAVLRRRYPRETQHTRLVIMGGARNEADQARAERLCQRAAALEDNAFGEERVQIRINVPRDELERALHGDFGCFLHTMEEEHFGISIVEAMFSGLVVIAHASGGAAHDILRPESSDEPLGFLYKTQDELIERLADVLFRVPIATLQAIQARARMRAQTMFSDEAFNSRFLRALASLNAKSSLFSADSDRHRAVPGTSAAR
ncbi:hypothetical protein CCYA_CCYA11G2993 [Cyanidiococcus yangmingshanensis]|nr:hypothetical protein CCYA_CCYA11G2993 [Cyanidiococcus yangmingshanensis]